MSIVYRSIKGSKLTSDEVDNNFAQLDGQGNAIVTQTGFSLSGQNLTINADWVWKIYGTQYTNSSAVVINIPLATSGNQRIDRIVANSSNTFERIPGTQSASNPVAPAVPLGKIEVTLINVTDGLVESGTGPISGQAYVKKESYSPYNSNVSGDDAEIVLNVNGYSEIRLTNPLLDSIAGVDVAAAISGSEPPYNGKPFRIRNLTGNSITIKHDSISVTNPFKLNANTDLVFPDNEIIHFIYDASGMIEDVKSFGSSVDISGKLDKVETLAAQRRFYAVNADGTQTVVNESDIEGAGSEGYNPNGYIVPDYYVPFGWVQAGQHNFNLCSPTISGDVSVRMEGGTTIVFMFSEPKLISEIYYSPSYLGNPTTGGNVNNFLLKGTLTKGVYDTNLLVYPITLHDGNSGNTPMANYSSRNDFFHPFKKVVLNNPATVCSLIFQAQTISSGTRYIISKILFK